jgi:hypothetical protein
MLEMVSRRTVCMGSFPTRDDGARPMVLTRTPLGDLLCAVFQRLRLYAGFVEHLRLSLREIVNERAIFYGAIILAARRDWRRKCLNGLDIGGMFFHKRQATPLYCRTGRLPLITVQILKMLPVCSI